MGFRDGGWPFGVKGPHDSPKLLFSLAYKFIVLAFGLPFHLNSKMTWLMCTRFHNASILQLRQAISGNVNLLRQELPNMVGDQYRVLMFFEQLFSARCNE